MENTTTIASISTVCNARRGRPGSERMRSRLIDTATNTSPVNAAAAPAVATNRSPHSETSYATKVAGVYVRSF